MSSLFLNTCLYITLIGLFTVAILGPFSAHFQTHFWLIFMYLAEKQTKVTENDAKNGYREHPGKEILEKWSKNAFFPSGTVPKR